MLHFIRWVDNIFQKCTIFKRSMSCVFVGVHACRTTHLFSRQQPPADGPIGSQGIYCKHHAGTPQPPPPETHTNALALTLSLRHSVLIIIIQ